MLEKKYKWWATGDVNAFFGLMLDNIAGLVLTVGMLSGIFGFPVDFALRYMIPGTALGVLVGDLLFFVLAFKLAKHENRSDVTAMPLGLDTPSTIGMVLFVLGPAFLAAKQSGLDEHAAALQTWHIGICAIVMTGLIKGVLALGSDWIRRVFPRAGLLGSLAAIALVLIAFTQMPKLISSAMVGLPALAIVLVTLIGRGRLPFKTPGALGAVVIGCAIWYMLVSADAFLGTQMAKREAANSLVWFPLEWLSVLQFQWLSEFPKAVGYLPYIIPFAIATVIGGIDCTESAASVGDNYKTSHVIGIEAFATLIAGFLGGVVQTTPYIGHPAYKAMGGRAAYTLATAIFVGGAGVIGYFSLLFSIIPEAAVLPILIFIGIEITAQSYHATPRRHYAALALACVPALAKLIMIYLGSVVSSLPDDFELRPDLAEQMLHLKVLAGGFIITSLIWASALAQIIDRKYFGASLYFAVGGMMVLFGFMHSPLDGDKMYWPWQLRDMEPALRELIVSVAAAYGVMAGIMFAMGAMFARGMLTDGPPSTIDRDEDFETIS
ncbi:MAG TPA: permease [Pirellulaceae bacterium]|nr:permease [Pirellulaceae bacterium]HMO94014.1 permease [Pirellulaceae bacterium]HMP70775.1 permease [Pirellulaceae bacterium]